MVRLQRKQTILFLCFCAHPVHLIHMYAYVRYFTLHTKNPKTTCSSICYCICSAVWTTGGKKKGGGVSVFFRQLNSWSCKYATLEQCCIQPRPTPFPEALQWQRDFACVHHKSQGILEKGPHKSRPVGNLKRGFLEVFILKWHKGRKIESGCSV